MSSHEERSWCSPGEPGGPPWWPAAAPDHFSASHAPDSASLPFGYKVPGHFPGTTASAPGGGPPGVSYHHQTQPQAHWWYPDRQGSDIGQRPLTQNKATMSKAKSETKPRGRMTAYAFFVQICREEHKKNHPDEHVAFADFSKKCAERWKTMSDKEKKRFHELAEKDKKRYETEMKDYTPSENEKGRRSKKRKQMKDPNAPKRSLSAFFWFCNDERGKVKEANPEYGVGDIAKELGRRWSEANPSIKSKYEELADKDKARYDREMTEYKKKGKVTTVVMENAKKEASEEEEEEEEDDDE